MVPVVLPRWTSTHPLWLQQRLLCNLHVVPWGHQRSSMQRSPCHHQLPQVEVLVLQVEVLLQVHVPMYALYCRKQQHQVLLRLLATVHPQMHMRIHVHLWLRLLQLHWQPLQFDVLRAPYYPVPLPLCVLMLPPPLSL